MTREEIYSRCLETIDKNPCLLMELATGTGKTRMAIDLVNHLCDTVFKGKKVNCLLLVAKRVHKETWKEEIEKWGGIKAEVIAECYESLKKHTDEEFDIVLSDEVHHIQSETRLELLSMVSFKYFIGLSATIPRNLKKYFKWTYKASIVSHNLVDAIESDILPQPKVLLMPLELNNVDETDYIELNPKAKGTPIYGRFCDRSKLIKGGKRVILSCTQKQKSNYLNSVILSAKNRYMRVRNKSAENFWLFQCNKRLEMLATFKVPVIKGILTYLDKQRTITFCKTIEQCEQLGSNCIHSKNIKSDEIYRKFNRKRIRHITTVNILNENANLVDCKYAVFCNLSSSEISTVQRIGRSLRHKSPVIIVPYYIGTREEELVQKMFEGYDSNYIQTIKSVQEI